ncbi:MAG: hypothetical protein J6P28_04270 [Treponema sp.]|nr:hypothetical protein [Treponema sp.]HBB14287.1 hypothetical protein [Treponema sp.]
MPQIKKQVSLTAKTIVSLLILFLTQKTASAQAEESPLPKHLETPVGTFSLEPIGCYIERVEWNCQELSITITADSQTTQEELAEQILYIEQIRRNFSQKTKAIRNFAAKEFDMEPTEENLSSFEILGITTYPKGRYDYAAHYWVRGWLLPHDLIVWELSDSLFDLDFVGMEQ